MPDNPNNGEYNSDDKPPFNDPEKDDENDPLGIRSVGGGVVVLILICGFLFAFAKIGEKGTEWVSGIVDSALGNKNTYEADSGKAEEEAAADEKDKLVEKDTSSDKQETKPDESVVKTTPKPKEPAIARSTEGLSKIENAKVQLVDQLGGSKKVEIRHIAFSKDDEAMVVSLRFLDGDGKTEEVYFSKDEFNRYIPKSDSIISGDIKIWQNEQ